MCLERTTASVIGSAFPCTLLIYNNGIPSTSAPSNLQYQQITTVIPSSRHDGYGFSYDSLNSLLSFSKVCRADLTVCICHSLFLIFKLAFLTTVRRRSDHESDQDGQDFSKKSVRSVTARSIQVRRHRGLRIDLACISRARPLGIVLNY